MKNYVLKISEAVREAGGRAMLVGGCVRDRLFGLEPKDFDLEVYHLEPARLREILQSIAPVNTVGEHFAVYKLAFYAAPQALNFSAPTASQIEEQADDSPSTRFEIDVSIPRRESKSGKGHRGFVIEGDPLMTFAEAARRRDFTINAILQDPLTDEIIDPFGGVADLQQRLLRVVAADTFVEDSLRVLRAVQFAARFELQLEPQTIALCRSIELADLPRERIYGEIEKLLWLAKRPSLGLQAALDVSVLDKLFPALRSLVDCQLDDSQMVDDFLNQPTENNNAFTRTKRRLDEAAKLASEVAKEKRLTLMLAALCQNLGRSAAHENAAVMAVLDTLGMQTIAGYDAREQILSLVREQQKPFEFYQHRERVTDGEFRRLAQRVDLNLLHLLTTAELRARGSQTTQAANWFKEKVQALGLTTGPPAPILMGRHLLEAGIKPGKEMGEILRRVYELQLDGAVTTLDEALAAAKP
ncbi:MAG: CCA tRNA nucleotidyltransferase [Acidobacteria bacterium]|nr:CCA tRNA nucleotidyltransferase [Acidobacteriota bacterium]